MSDISRLNALAKAFAIGEQRLDAVVARGASVIGRPSRMVQPVAERYLAAFSGRTRPRHRDVVQFLRQDRSWVNRQSVRDNNGGAHDRARNLAPDRAQEHNARALTADPRQVRRAPSPMALLSLADRMQPVSAASTWQLPQIESVGALAEWFGVSIQELLWFSDARRRAPSVPTTRLHHYHYRVVVKPHGGIRIIEAPQARLRDMQRRMLTDILEQVPLYYDAAHGFVKGRSVRTFAQPHVGRRVVLRMDLEDFFPRISMSRIQSVFRTMGYPEAVADCLGGLSCNAVPHAVLSQALQPPIDIHTIITARRLYTRPHVPQGAPTSPALANICAYHMDCRLTGLADWAGAEYTRYADDLAFSGGSDFARNVSRYATQIAVIVQQEGWPVQHHKTRVMRCGVRQHLAGVVVNTRLNISRTDFDTLKAILTNCVRYGPSSQNRDGVPNFRAHLQGRITWVASLNPAKGKRLTQIFSQICWSDAT